MIPRGKSLKWGLENVNEGIRATLEKIQLALDNNDIQTVERYFGELCLLLKSKEVGDANTK